MENYLKKISSSLSLIQSQIIEITDTFSSIQTDLINSKALQWFLSLPAPWKSIIFPFKEIPTSGVIENILDSTEILKVESNDLLLNLEPLKKFKSLKELHINIKSQQYTVQLPFSIFHSLSTLKKIFLEGELSDNCISSVSSISNLEHLSIKFGYYKEEFISIAPIFNLQKLITLEIVNFPENFSFENLVYLLYLKKFSCKGDYKVNMEYSLEKLSELEELNLDIENLNLDFLQSLKKLKKLTLKEKMLKNFNLKTLTLLPLLEIIKIDSIRREQMDIDFAILLDCPSIKYIEYYNFDKLPEVKKLEYQNLFKSKNIIIK